MVRAIKNLTGGASLGVVAIFLFSVVFLSAPAISLAAFGVSPPYVNADHLVPGATYSQVIYLVQDQPTQDLNIAANLTLSEPARSWISIDKGFNFVIPAGTHQFPVTVTVTVPQNAALGVYNGTVSFVGAPAQAGQVTIALGVQVAINLTVGTGIFRSFSVPYLKVLDIEEGWDPRVLVRFQNQGNVTESVDGATFALYDQYDAVQLAEAQVSNGLPQVPPFTTKEYTVSFPTGLHLGLGQYWGVVNFYQNGQVIESEKEPFNVLPPGSLSSPTAVIFSNLKGYWLYYLGALLLLLLVVWQSRRVLARRRIQQ